MMSAMSIEPESRDSVGASFPRESLDITGLPAAVADELRRLVHSPSGITWSRHRAYLQSPPPKSRHNPGSGVFKHGWTRTRRREKGTSLILTGEGKKEKGKRDITDIDRQEPVGPERTQTRTDVPFPFPFPFRCR